MKKIALLLLCLPVVSNAQQTFTLLEAQTYALENNPSAKLAKLELEQAEYKVDEFRAIGLPQVSAEGNFQHFLDIPTSLIPAQAFNPMASPDEFVGVQFGTEFNLTGGFTVSQLLFDGSYLVGLKASKMYPVLSQKNQEKTKKEIRANVAQAYYMVAVTNKNISFLDEITESNEALKKYLNIMQEKGMMDSTSIDQIDLSIRKLESQKKKAALDKQLALKSLKMSMGLDLNTAIDISEDIDMILAKISAASGDSFNPENDPTFQLLMTSKELQEMNLTVKKSAFLPSLAAFFSHQQQALRNDFDFFQDKPWFPSTIWGLKLSIPIFSSGMRTAQVKQQEIEIKKVEANMELVKQGLQLEYEAAMIELQGATDIYNAEQEAYAIAERIKRRTDIKYQKKVASMLEVAQADLQLEQSRSSLIQAMYGMVTAKTKLDKILNQYE